MKKIILIAIAILVLFLCLSVSAEKTKRKPRKIRILTEKIDLKLDSIIQTEPYKTIQGREYYRFNHGVLRIVTPDSISGVFIIGNRIHFTSNNGEIVFSGVDGTDQCYKKNLEKLLCILKEPY